MVSHRAHDVETTLYERCNDVKTLKRRRINVVLTLRVGWVIYYDKVRVKGRVLQLKFEG